ncbi:MAG TPA: hypothetical protein VML01_04555 [Bryobacterales bacterium]|nr:hypothetical protein [Bryobacterales bacterium]
MQPFDSFAQLLEDVSPFLRIILAAGFVLFAVGITLGIPIMLFSGCSAMAGALAAHNIANARWYEPLPPYRCRWWWGRLIGGLAWLALALFLLFLAGESR